MAHGYAREGKWRGNWRKEWVASTLTLPRNVVYPPLLTLMSTPRLPAVDWTDAHTNLNGLVRFGERRNLVSATVPTHFKRSLLPGTNNSVTNWLNAAGSFFTSSLFLSQSINSPHFKVPDGSSPCSQQRATCPYPEPYQSSPHHAIIFQNQLNVTLSSTSRSSKRLFPPDSLLRICTCHMPRPSHPPWCDDPNTTLWGKQSCLFSLRNFLHSPVTSSLLHRNTFLNTHFRTFSAYGIPSLWQTKFHTHTKQQTNLSYIPKYQNARRKMLTAW